jgi:hypothetical protein
LFLFFWWNFRSRQLTSLYFIGSYETDFLYKTTKLTVFSPIYRIYRVTAHTTGSGW